MNSQAAAAVYRNEIESSEVCVCAVLAHVEFGLQLESSLLSSPKAAESEERNTIFHIIEPKPICERQQLLQTVKNVRSNFSLE
jgi:hypothetical protein